MLGSTREQVGERPGLHSQPGKWQMSWEHHDLALTKTWGLSIISYGSHGSTNKNWVGCNLVGALDQTVKGKKISWDCQKNAAGENTRTWTSGAVYEQRAHVRAKPLTRAWHWPWRGWAPCLPRLVSANLWEGCWGPGLGCLPLCMYAHKAFLDTDCLSLGPLHKLSLLTDVPFRFIAVENCLGTVTCKAGSYTK